MRLARSRSKGLFRTARAAIDDLRAEREPEPSDEEGMEILERVSAAAHEAVANIEAQEVDATGASENVDTLQKPEEDQPEIVR